jgi:hypothetical protein
MRSLTASLVVGLALAGVLAASLRAEETAAFDPGVVRRITPAEVQRRRDAGEKMIVLDARGSVADGMIRGAVHVPSDQLDAWAKGVRKDALIVAYCT